ncbi:hypothetical protein A9G47_05085 [Gilliamella sp. WF3-4]|nr:hypothetical protein A9G47_05085 [Gilliamella apicola]
MSHFDWLALSNGPMLMANQVLQRFHYVIYRVNMLTLTIWCLKSSLHVRFFRLLLFILDPFLIVISLLYPLKKVE